MQRREILLIVALLIAIVGGMFTYAYIKRSAMSTPSNTVKETPVDPQTLMNVTRIDAKHYFTDPPGVHTLAGELPMPTPCDLLNANAVLLDDGKRAVVSFDVVNNSGGQCEQKVTAQRFKVGFKAAKDIKIEATFKGKPVELNLIPAAAGENPADFELFIKG